MIRKKIKDIEVNMLMSLKESDITLDFLKKLFAVRRVNGKDEQALDYRGEMTISQDMINRAEVGIILSEDRIVTTPGRYITNLFLFGHPEIRPLIKYVNEPIDKGVLGSIEDQIADLLKEKKISSDAYMDFIDRIHWFSFAPTSFVAPSLESSVLSPLPEVTKLKKELFEKNKAAIQRADVTVIGNIEKQLLSLAKEILSKRDSPGLEVYNSGAAGSFANNYKNVAVMRGAIPKSSDMNQFFVSDANLSDGIPQDELDKYADLMVTASFSRAVGTQSGGYIVKQFNAAFGHVTLDAPGSDCGTKQLLTITLTKQNAKRYYLRYAVNKDGSYSLMDNEFLKNNIGKTLTLRSGQYCLTDKVCSKCAGELYYRLGTKNIGGMFCKIGSNILQKSLKRFHDLTVKTANIDILGSFKEL